MQTALSRLGPATAQQRLGGPFSIKRVMGQTGSRDLQPSLSW